MDGNKTRVSVITTVHNGERFLAQAVDSILGQTFTNFEYLLVDDCSTDDSPGILQRYAGQDDRVVLLRTEVQINHSNAINTALKQARGEFVAILDADDVAHPQRLERQVAFLEARPAVGAAGTYAQQIDEDGHVGHVMSFPVTCELARWGVLFSTPVLHSAAMIRLGLLQEIGGYSVQWRYANDYSLWAELITRTGIASVPEVLVSYRRHSQQTSSIHSKAQQGEVWLLIYKMLAERLGLRARLDDIGALFQGVRGRQLEDAGAPTRAGDLLAAIRERYLCVEQLDTETACQIDLDCAQRLLQMAWVHRRTHRTEARKLLLKAKELDAQIWQREQTRAMLRRLRERERRAVAERTTAPTEDGGIGQE